MEAVIRVSTNKVKSQEPLNQLNHFGITNHTMLQRFGDSNNKIINKITKHLYYLETKIEWQFQHT